ncbi:MAG: rhomboid family intramembrane serine protease [Prevotellaceae bacterium]|nr:rhomboid family intramembrane serine protease [Prevotellaceae bacterium]
MDDQTIDEKKEIRLAVVYSALLTLLPWLVQLIGVVFSLQLKQFGLKPLEWKGLSGIFTMPLLHADWEHLISNTPAMWLLIFGLFLFYKRDAWPILLCLCLLSGFLTWLMGRNSTHIGASGLVYALAAFHFLSGVIKKELRQRAFALLVAFFYGGFVWAFFPTLYRGTSISWEGHLSGLIAGILFAFYFRDKGPAPPVYPFLEDEDGDAGDTEEVDRYWDHPEDTGSPGINTEF